ncbi:MAG TPA: cytochrome C, partial [Nitrospirae bacterium]|nr:cytochrome C [Nitrospirota bacterium]
MKKLLILTVALAMALAFIGTAMAVPPGKTLKFETKMGTVVFSGKIHADAGMKCNNCHPKVFKMKKGADKIT